ncbi:nucleotidyltransferase [Tenacibaculum dicentrarchi]|uniref:nucleotidyltransferase n=1 Tax=Tenacibaculum dicentrarchi TaxID=669041 RepID=UPI003513C1B9
MAKYNEDTLNRWRKPPSNTEETKLSNAERMIKEAISENDELNGMDIDIYGKGSYANDTNVRLNSDIDICVCLRDTIFIQLPKNKEQEDFGYKDSSYKFSDFKDTIEQALIDKFGDSELKRNDKCITIKENSYRVEADVVPSFEYHRYDDNGSKHIGTKFISDKGYSVINYPKQHIKNAKEKNAKTKRRYKRLTRIVKRIRYKMIDDGEEVSDKINSFLLECLIWNVPNKIFINCDTWTDRLKEALIYLYQNTKEKEDCKEWGEVSELLYLFVGHKWNRKTVNEFIVQMWTYLEFE